MHAILVSFLLSTQYINEVIFCNPKVIGIENLHSESTTRICSKHLPVLIFGQVLISWASADFLGEC